MRCEEEGVYKITVYRNTFSEEIRRRQENVATRESGIKYFLTCSRTRRELRGVCQCSKQLASFA